MSKSSVKILVLGSRDTGKTSLISSFNSTEFDPVYNPTTCSDFTLCEITTVDGVEVTGKIWDVGGNNTMCKSLMKGLDAVILVVDLTSKHSMSCIDALYERINPLSHSGRDDFPCYLIGNKLDLAEEGEEREISSEELKKWCVARRPNSPGSIRIFETSAKTGHNVSVAIQAIADQAIQNSAAKARSGTLAPQSPASMGLGQAKANTRAPGSSHFSPPKAEANGVSENGKGDGNKSDQRAEMQSEGEVTKVKESNLNESLPSISSTPSSSPRKQPGLTLEQQKQQGEEDEINTTIKGKVIIAGAAAVGKTSILHRFVGDNASSGDALSQYDPTVGVDFRIAHLPVQDSTLELQIWDSAGDKKLMSLGRSIYKNADFLVLVYDMTDRSTFLELETYWSNFILYAKPEDPENIPCVLVGNKCDAGRRATDLEEVMAWCASKRPRRPIAHLECSALRSIGVHDVFIVVADDIYDYHTLTPETDNASYSLAFDDRSDNSFARSPSQSLPDTRDEGERGRGREADRYGGGDGGNSAPLRKNKEKEDGGDRADREREREREKNRDTYRGGKGSNSKSPMMTKTKSRARRVPHSEKGSRNGSTVHRDPGQSCLSEIPGAELLGCTIS